MRVLIIHNFYTNPGGEDTAFRDHTDILRAQTETTVRVLCTRNLSCTSIYYIPIFFIIACSRMFSFYGRFLYTLIIFRPDIIHFHNTFFIISPAALFLARMFTSRVYLTLHNYRNWCATSTFFRDGRICTDCVSRSRLSALKFNCCDSYFKTILMTVYSAFSFFSVYLTSTTAVYLSKSQHVFIQNKSKCQFLKSKILSNSIFFNDSQSSSNQKVMKKNCALFVGRLDEKKGFHLFSRYDFAPFEVNIKIIGGGPLNSLAKSLSNKFETVHYMGSLTRREVLSEMLEAKFLIIPSIWLEGDPMIYHEAISLGTVPIISKYTLLAEEIQSELPDEISKLILFDPFVYSDLPNKLSCLMDDTLFERVVGSLKEKQRNSPSNEIDNLWKKIYEI